ncbi:MAG: oxidative damage protection protein [Ignavibacteriae bacterium]|nr:MAG: oxidative damage protection protein [Ignavibacteriota bacterium]
MADRMVNCIKLGQVLPGLESPPTPSKLGMKVYENVSQQAWNDFLELFKMIINEYRLDLTSPMADQVFEQKMEEYFFSDNITLPDGYVPPENKP